ncbi:MAG: DUF4173 domain-containing protein [Anaerolineales bacterium]|nr:DUF4173 domain-containing protein [Anaerolineales bacterium]
MVKNRSTLWYSALIVGWAFDILYWKKPLGISFAIHLLLLLGALYFLSVKESKKPSPKILPLVGLILLFSFLGFMRAEPFTRTLNHLLSLGFLALFLLSYQGGRWMSYTLSDYFVGFFRLVISAIGLPVNLLTETKEEKAQGEGEEKVKGAGWKSIAPYLRGILLALPVVAVLAALLSEADPIFSEWLQELIKLLRLEKLPEYILRMFLISIWTFLLAGLFLHALGKSKEEKLVGLDQTWPPRFLGFTETKIILGAVNLLFFSFVTIQFRYFFGGEKNISLEGFTYSEYARRGFGELLAVAFFSLFIIMVLSSITRREEKKDRITFSVLTGLITAFIGVILFSSLQRLALYEAAYGFTRLRTYSHLCILWIGVLFLAILVLEILQQYRFFTLASIAAVAGFVLTMNAVNVDSFITQKNIQRLAEKDAVLDTYTLKSLSVDGLPTLIQLAEDPNISDKEKTEVAAILACQEKRLHNLKSGWQGFLVPNFLAKKALQENEHLWKDTQLKENEYGSYYAEIGTEDFYCNYIGWD